MSERHQLTASLPGGKRHTCRLSSCAVGGRTMLPAGRSPWNQSHPVRPRGISHLWERHLRRDAIEQRGWWEGVCCSPAGSLHHTPGSGSTRFTWAPSRQWMLCHLSGGARYPQPPEEVGSRDFTTPTAKVFKALRSHQYQTVSQVPLS